MFDLGSLVWWVAYAVFLAAILAFAVVMYRKDHSRRRRLHGNRQRISSSAWPNNNRLDLLGYHLIEANQNISAGPIFRQR